MPRRLPGAAAIVAAAAPSALAFVPSGIASNVRRAAPPASVAYLYASSGDDEGSAAAGITFFLSPSSLTHLSYLDGPDVPPPVYASALVSDDDDDDDDVNDDVASSPAANLSLSTIVGAKLPALAVGLLGAVVVGYGGTHFLEDVFHLDLLTAGPLLYFLGFSTGWQAMGGDKVEMEPQISAPDGNVDDDRDASSIQYVLDRPIRLRKVLQTLEKSNARIITAPTTDQGRDLSKATKYLPSAHTQKYCDALRKSCESVSSAGGIRRLSNGSSRTFIDSASFDAALSAVQDWIDAVDFALAQDTPAFALTRPPSHHACPTRGMGGCLLNGCAVAAYYALKTHPDVERVAILDIDAHHGNGIAACVQDRPPIRYCRIHEFSRGEAATLREPRADNPRGPGEGDVGPRMNCKNVVLVPGVGWDDEVGGDIKGYEHALTQRAIPFLAERKPDLLLVACGFDALEEDGTSKLCLQPTDYRKIGYELKKVFGNSVVLGLEGGYCWAGDSLGKSMLGEASVFSWFLLVYSTCVAHYALLVLTPETPTKKSTRLPPQSVLWTHWAATTILVLFF